VSKISFDLTRLALKHRTKVCTLFAHGYRWRPARSYSQRKRRCPHCLSRATSRCWRRRGSWWSGFERAGIVAQALRGWGVVFDPVFRSCFCFSSVARSRDRCARILCDVHACMTDGSKFNSKDINEAMENKHYILFVLVYKHHGFVGWQMSHCHDCQWYRRNFLFTK
jgi:hypothetical protein